MLNYGNLILKMYIDLNIQLIKYAISVILYENMRKKLVYTTICMTFFLLKGTYVSDDPF